MSTKMNIKVKKDDVIFGASSFGCFLISFLLIKFSSFSSSTLISFQSYLVQAVITQATGTGTLESLFLVLQPFQLVFLGIIFYIIGLSVLSTYGYYKDEDNAGKFVGLFSAILALILFQSLWGAFLAACVLVSCFFSASLANTYKKELKKWIPFRVGSHTMGKMFTLLAIFMSVGIFVVIMSNQTSYSAIFKQDLVETTKTIAMSVPGAEMLPESVIDSQIESLIDTSPMFEAYVTWMPLTTALAVWFVLEFLVLFATAIGGAFTYTIIRIFHLK